MLNKTAQNIKNRLSLREPQAKSLEILTTLADTLPLRNTADIASEREAVKTLHPTTFSDFERDFPSVTFSLATGVGKTRLMGAFIAYLYTEKGIKNFFVIAPGNTIYNKLIDDLSNPNSPKYVFHGISEFAVTPPKIITGENYNDSLTGNIFGETIRINIFNIQKISSEMRGGKEPRIKRLSEYLGESYFDYLSGLDDLVVLMDESHHYRAAAGMKAINELKAVLGLELTATPIDSQGEKFKNVVFEYSLAHGLRDGFLKEPAVATRRDFNPDQYTERELDLMKLEDGVRLHEDTKVHLDIYARENHLKRVKPFVLVAARNTEHATNIKALMESGEFFGGRYKGKVLEVTSGTTGSSEKDEVIEQLLSVEDPDNPIEIVIHVYMLKEGWDVTNLYTIIPLNAARAQILTEQTIGRGLRLPYGKRTGVPEVDRLTIIAHDRYQAIIDDAKRPDSLIRKENIIELNIEDLVNTQKVVTTTSVLDEELGKRKNEIDAMTNVAEREVAQRSHEVTTILTASLVEVSNKAKNVAELSSETIMEAAIQNFTEQINVQQQPPLFKQQYIEEARQQYAEVVQNFTSKIIPIPRIFVQQIGGSRVIFDDFDLDVSALNYQPVSEDILIQSLQTSDKTFLYADGSINVRRDTPENIIVNELINFSDIDYDETSNQLYKHTRTALAKLSVDKTPEQVVNIVLYFKKRIADLIYAQMKQHFRVETGAFEAPKVYPFSKIEPHNFSMYERDSIHLHTDTIEPINAIPSKVFAGFVKACHSQYKFHSKAEKDFATLLESDESVLKWLRPASAQFQIYWDNNSKRYDPDFVVETESVIYMVETKASNELNSEDVIQKAQAASLYCSTATTYNQENGGKAWVYVLIPHDQVRVNSTFPYLVQTYQYRDNN